MIKKQYKLDEIYKDESTLQRYKRIVAGEEAGYSRLFFQELVTGLFGSAPTILGIGLRKIIYPIAFTQFSRSSIIGRQVTLRCPRNIQISENVIVDDFVQLISNSNNPQSITLGRGSFLRSYAMLNAGPPDGFIHIGENTSIGQSSILYGNGGLTIGNDVMIAGQCFIVASSHNTSDKTVPMTKQGYSAIGINIGNNVWIGAGAKILDGVTIGEGSIIGANTVVTKNVEPWSTIVGVPGRPIPRISELNL